MRPPDPIRRDSQPRVVRWPFLEKPPWSAPAPLGPIVNTTSGETFPSLSADRMSLYFNSDRPDLGFGASDLYVGTRTR